MYYEFQMSMMRELNFFLSNKRKKHRHTSTKIHQGDVEEIQQGRLKSNENSHSYVYSIKQR